ncbi:MAG: protein-disulfide reductase DsbD [Achromobacter sp.]|nr:protein-disulfide reductase DsbD [Achromobacter sp.]
MIRLCTFKAFAHRWLPWLAALSLAMWSSLALSQDAFLDPEQAFRLEASRGADNDVRLTWRIADGYYLYRDRITAQRLPQATPIALQTPPGESKNDPNFGVMEVYHTQARATLAPAGEGTLRITWQGCADAGLCYPPQTRDIAVNRLPVTDTPTTVPEESAADLDVNSDLSVSRALGDNSLWWNLAVFLALGVGLAFTPCVLPMLPIVSSLVVGANASPRRGFVLSLVFVLPMAGTYAAMGVAAAMAGASLQATLQNPYMLGVLGVVFVALAFAMFGYYSLQLPAALRDRLDRAGRQHRGGTLIGAAAMGTVSALLVGPCMTAPLAGTLLYIADSGDTVRGAAILFALGIGMGLPMLAVGALGPRLLPRPGPWMERVKAVFGFLLLGTAVLMVERIVPPPTTLLLWSGLAIAIASALAVWSWQVRSRAAYQALLASISIPTMAWGLVMLMGAAAGQADPARPLAFLAERGQATSNPTAESDGFVTLDSPQALHDALNRARSAGRPAVLDFSAQWCVSCKKIEREVYPLPEVQAALSSADLIRFDLSQSTPDQLALLRRLRVPGPPSVLFFAADGLERRQHRVTGEFDASTLLTRYHLAQEAP